MTEEITAGETVSNVRRPGLALWFGAAALFVALLAAAVLPLYAALPNAGLWQPAVLLLLGLVAAWLFARQSGAGFSACLLLAATLLVVWTAASVLRHQGQWPELLTGLAAFLLPPVLAEAWRQFRRMELAARPLWFYSKALPDEPPFSYLENRTLRLRIVNGGGEPEEFTTTAAVSMPLGQVFFYAVKEGRNPQDWTPYFFEPNGKPAAWTFYTPRLFFGKNYLHPQENLEENQIEPTAVVVAERLRALNPAAAKTALA